MCLFSEGFSPPKKILLFFLFKFDFVKLVYNDLKSIKAKPKQKEKRKKEGGSRSRPEQVLSKPHLRSEMLICQKTLFLAEIYCKIHENKLTTNTA